MLIAQRASILLACLITALIILSGIDYLFRFPAALRSIQLIIAVVALIILITRYILPAIRFNPNHTELALRIEKIIPQLENRFASGVEFALSGIDKTSPLAARAVAEAQRRADQESLYQIIKRQNTLISLTLLIITTLILTTAFLTIPDHSAIAARRILLPLSQTNWPKHVNIQSAITANVYPQDRNIPLQAKITKGLDKSMRVYAQYQLFDKSGKPLSKTSQVVLTYQRDNLFERLIDPRLTENSIDNLDHIQVWFTSRDDQTEKQTIYLVPPPSIAHAYLSVTPPDYAAHNINPLNNLDLGSGTYTDNSSSSSSINNTQPILIGSNVILTFEFNKPIPAPQNSTTQNIKTLLAWDPLPAENAQLQPINININNNNNDNLPPQPDNQNLTNAWQLSWTMQKSLTLEPTITDQHGITSNSELYYRLDAIDDQQPTIAITNPLADLTLSTDARIPIKAEARDDVQIDYQKIIAKLPDAKSKTPDIPNTSKSTETTTLIELASITGSKPRETLETNLTINSLKVNPGDLIEIYAQTKDNYNLDNQQHDPVYSSIRRIRIISSAEFVDQLLLDLTRVRDRAIRLIEEQTRLQKQMNEDQLSTDEQNQNQNQNQNYNQNQRQQSAISQQIARQSETINSIQQRVNQNNLNNQNLTQTITQATKHLNEAGEKSNQASESLVQLQNANNPPDDKELSTEIKNSQNQVIDSLSELVDLLDSGQDTWVVRNKIDRLLAEQKLLQKQNEKISSATRGKNLDELTEANKQTLKDIAEEQAKLAQQSTNLVDDIQNQADSLQNDNPDLSQSLQKAASEAVKNQLDQKMLQAAKQIEANQGQRASDNQQSAIQTLESMINQLDLLEKTRAERLKRQIDSLLESLNALIIQQQTQLTALNQAVFQNQQQQQPKPETQNNNPVTQPDTDNQNPYQGLDTQLIKLNTNTYAVKDFAQEAGNQQLAPAIALIEIAANAQENAVIALRSNPVNSDSSIQNETISLNNLEKAHDLVQQMQQRMQQQENAQKKQELIQKYQQLLQLQLEVNAKTQNLQETLLTENNNLTRKLKLTARKLAADQSAIQAASTLILQNYPEITSAIVFKVTHDRLDETMQYVIDNLQNPQDTNTLPTTTIIFDQNEIASLYMALIIALNDTPDNSEFEDEQIGDNSASGGGGGGGGGGGNDGNNKNDELIPTIAQLKLLRGLQDSIYQSTKTLNSINTSGQIAAEILNDRINRLGTSQTQLTELTQQFLEELQKQALPAPPPQTQPDN